MCVATCITMNSISFVLTPDVERDVPPATALQSNGITEASVCAGISASWVAVTCAC